MRLGGSSAQIHGNAQEEMIESVIIGMQNRGATVTYQKHISVYESIYGMKKYEDFVVNGLKNFPDGLVIESKFQSVAGSGDEKVPYMLENIFISPLPTLIIANYEARPGSPIGVQKRFDAVTKYIHKKVEEHHNNGGKKLVAVITPGQFTRWLQEQID